MMSRQTLFKIIAVLAFCTATLGAAGLQDVDALTSWPSDGPAPRAFWPLVLVIVGLVTLIVSGLAGRAKDPAAASDGDQAGEKRDRYNDLLGRVVAAVDELVHESLELDRQQLLDRIDSICEREFFELTSRHEEIASHLGFTGYAAVWDGVATAERYLARAWSLATDGHEQDAREILPVVQARLAHARDALASA
jgi:hypothetical protein